MKKTARILAVILALAMMISLVACGASDSKDTEKKEETSAVTEAATEEATQPENASPLAGTWENRAYGTAYTFNSDGTGVLTGEGYVMDFTYEDKETYVDIDYSAATKVQSVDYTIDGDILTLANIEYTKK